LEPIKAPVRSEPFVFDENQMQIYEKTKMIESFRFVDWEDFSSAAVHLPIDKVVADLVKERY
jgi:8-oxo-dGTP diphosphatase